MLLIIVVFGKLFLQCRKLNIWRRKPFYETYKDRPELSTLLREKKEYESLLRDFTFRVLCAQIQISDMH